MAAIKTWRKERLNDSDLMSEKHKNANKNGKASSTEINRPSNVSHQEFGGVQTVRTGVWYPIRNSR
jgi:hypothetical protein